MVKFRVFNTRELVETQVTQIVLFKERTVTISIPKYKSVGEVYIAAASFAAELGRERLITITGTPWAESHDSYATGDVVVWYYERTEG